MDDGTPEDSIGLTAGGEFVWLNRFTPAPSDFPFTLTEIQLLTIGTSGRVDACSVTSSSGSSALDQATCRILRSRARYTPARDEDGNPTTGHDSGRVTWRLPSE